MSEQNPLHADLTDFSGSAPLFPLPNGVFFPGILFPLHIFERRYRKMTADALDGDRLIAMALLKPGWEMLPADRVPPIYDTVCLSRITAEERLPDGRYYLVLQGLARARVVGERSSELPYRIGELELCSDEEANLADADDQRIRENLLRGVQALYPELAVNPLFVQALDQELPLGTFCDILAHSLPLPLGQSQRILEELDVVRRSQIVVQAMQSELNRREKDSTSLHYPPKFSQN